MIFLRLLGKKVAPDIGFTRNNKNSAFAADFSWLQSLQEKYLYTTISFLRIVIFLGVLQLPFWFLDNSKCKFARIFQFLTPLPPCSFLVVLHAPPPPPPPLSRQRTFALMSYPLPHLKKSFATLMTLISNKKSGCEKREKN